MRTLSNAVKRHPLTTFFILAYALSWLVVVPTRGSLLPWGPALAAIIVLAFTDGKAGVSAWLGHIWVYHRQPNHHLLVV